MPNRNPIYRALTVVTLLVLLLGSAPVTAAPALSTAEGPALSEVAGAVGGSEVGGVHTLGEHSAEAVTRPEDIPADWWAIVQEDIRRSEYHLRWQDETHLPGVPAAYQAPNRAHNLRTYFTTEGPVLIPRVWAGVETPPWRWGLRLTAWGREGALQPVQAATLHPDTNRVEYRRGEVVEWYVNDERGLEQGFTLTAPPESEASTDESHVVLEMAFSGSLALKLTAAGDAVELSTSDGQGVVRYGALHALDATGRELPARIAVSNRHVSILVDTEGAVYPLTIAPVITGLSSEADWTYNLPVFVPPINAYVGCSVATAGDVNGDGYSDVIVGAYGYDSGQTDEGKVLVFYGSATGLDTSVSWAAESNQATARFGWSAATAGDVNGDGYADVIVGAFWYDNSHSNEGAAFVYHGSATGLDLNGTRTGGTPQNADWMAQSNQDEARLGIRVATAGDVNGDGCADVIVGADEYDDGQSGEGAAFVYHGSATGLGPDGTPQNADWMAESDQADASFGNSVATAGDVNGDGYTDVIVGAPYYDNGHGAEGRAYVYHGSAAGLSTTAWTAESNQGNARLGSVATAGDVNGDGYADVIIGAYFYFAGQTREGAAFVYHGSATGLDLNGTRTSGTPQNADWWVESNQYDAQLGGSVGTAGDVNGDGYADVIVGASLYDGAQTDGGAAFVYHGSATGLGLDGTRPAGNPSNADWADEGDQEEGKLGFSVATAGDVNGDGFADVVAGTPYYDVLRPPYVNSDAGQASVYHGSPMGLSTDAAWDQQGDYAETWRLGSSVATAGDVNGDGYADVIVGAPRYGTYNRGMVLVYHGSASGLSDTADWTAVGNVSVSEMRFGFSVATAGDVNGDGYDDVIVGTEDFGRAYVYHGSSSGLDLNGVRPTGNPDNADWTATGSPDQVGPSRFGFSVGTAGDVNGDGYADVIVGAPGYNGYPYTREGWAYVYHGSVTGLSTEPDWPEPFYEQTDSLFGFSVATAGDVNRDGYSDVVVGAPGYNKEEPFPAPDAGAVFAYYGSALGLSDSPDWEEYYGHSYLEGGFFGRSVATAGDVNGDGYADVIVGYPYWSSQPQFGLGDGMVYVYYGAAIGLSGSYDWSSPDCNPSYSETHFGWSVGTAGDVNGDGHADVIIGAPFTQFGDNMGQAFVFHGSATGLPGVPCLGLAWNAVCIEEDAQMGWSVATAGDVNGDGYADVIVGAPNFSTSGTGSWTEGRAYVYYGNGGAGLSLNPRQRSADDSAPIAHRGASGSASSFRLALRGRTPFGRGKVKLEWEVKPLGTLFDGTGTRQSATWVNPGATGADLNELVSGLAFDTAYHWRVRLHYHPATTPFQQYSRWLTMPWNGWTEQDLRTGSPTYLPLVLRTYP